jgi:hypothetical protein
MDTVPSMPDRQSEYVPQYDPPPADPRAARRLARAETLLREILTAGCNCETCRKIREFLGEKE